MYDTRPLAPEEFTASLWEEVNALKEAISMSGRARPWQKTKKFLDGLEQGTTSLTDEELVIGTMRLWRRLIQYSTVTLDRRAPKYRPVHVFVWKRTKRV